jgi:hypothetical protein
VRTIAAEQNTDEQALDQIQRECVQTLEGLSSRYETFATCVEQAATSAAVLECETELAKPPSLLANASPTARLENLCGHIITVLQGELPDMGNTVDANQVEALRKRCIEEAGAKLSEHGEAEFSKLSDCILAATNLQALQACGSF